MSSMVIVLSLITAVSSAALRLQSSPYVQFADCHYEITGEELKNKAKRMAVDDGSEWAMVMKDGKEMLQLKFNSSVTIYQIVLQLRHNRIVRITSDDNEGNVIPNVFNVAAGRNNVLKNQVEKRPTVRKLTLQGYFMPIHEDDINLVEITACSADCFEPQPCYGNCKLTARSGCMECICPKDSLSKGCSGYTDNKDMYLLLELAKRKTKGCQFVQGYRRHRNKNTGFDDCVSISYARCDWYLKILMPRTRAECLQHCF